METPSEEDIRRRYEESVDAFGHPEQRSVLSIYRRSLPNRDGQTAEDEVEALRQRVLDGENFSILAKEHSESENRHMGGLVGMIRPGQLPPDLDEIIFALDEGVPSRPIVTRDGVHMFFVETDIKGKIPSFEEAAADIARALARERSEAALAQLVDETDLPPVALVFGQVDIRELIADGRHDTIILSIGNYELSLGELREIALRQRTSQGEDTKTLAEDMAAQFAGIRRREILHHRFTSEGKSLSEETLLRFEAQKEVFLVRRFLEATLRNAVPEEELRTFYKVHRKRFTRPLRLRLRGLVIPLGETPNRTMARLEKWSRELESGQATLETVARDFGAKTQDSDWVDLETLTQFRPKAAFFAPSIDADEFSPPYNTGRSFEIFQVLERQEPEPLDFETARNEVLDSYLERHGQALYDAMVEDRLSAARLVIFNDRIFPEPPMSGRDEAPQSWGPPPPPPTSTLVAQEPAE